MRMYLNWVSLQTCEITTKNIVPTMSLKESLWSPTNILAKAALAAQKFGDGTK